MVRPRELARHLISAGGGRVHRVKGQKKKRTSSRLHTSARFGMEQACAELTVPNSPTAAESGRTSAGRQSRPCAP